MVETSIFGPAFIYNVGTSSGALHLELFFGSTTVFGSGRFSRSLQNIFLAKVSNISASVCLPMLGTLLPFVIAIPPGLPSVSSMGPSLDACFFTCRGVAFATQSEWISRMKISKYTLDSLCCSQCMTYPRNVFYVRAWSRISVPFTPIPE